MNDLRALERLQQPQSRLGSHGRARHARKRPQHCPHRRKPQAPAAGANLAQGTETGIGTFQQRCMGCHGNPKVPHAPSPDDDPPDAARAHLRCAHHRRDEAAGRLPHRRPEKNARHVSQRPPARQRAGRRREVDAQSLRDESAVRRSRRRPRMERLGQWPHQHALPKRRGRGTHRKRRPESESEMGVRLSRRASPPSASPPIVSGRVFVGTDIGLHLFAQRGYRLHLLVVSDERLGAHRDHGGAASPATPAPQNTPRISATRTRTPTPSTRRRASRSGSRASTHNFVARITAAPDRLRRPHLRPALELRGILRLVARLSLLHVARQRRRARCQHRQNHLEDLRRPARPSRAGKIPKACSTTRPRAAPCGMRPPST